MKSKKLAVSIPTQNRASILVEDLTIMLDEIKEFSIPIYVSDDSISSQTEIMVNEFKKNTYPFISYSRNVPPLGHDKNCLRTLALTTEEYTWYLGDSVIIEKGGISKVLMAIDSFAPDFVTVNVLGRKLDIQNTLFEDGNKLLAELGWHLTQTGATIYSRRTLNRLASIDTTKCKNFPQTSIVFEAFSLGKSSLYWINEKLVYGNPRKQSYWNDKVFDVFLSDWRNCIMNLPSTYLMSNKEVAFKMHNLKTGLFSLTKIVSYRLKGFYNYKTFKKYYRLLKENSNVNIVILFTICIAPRMLLSSLFVAYRFFFGVPRY